MLRGANACKSCRSRQELSNEYLLTKFGFDTAENFGSRGELRRWGLLHAGDGVLDRGSDGLLGTWITIDYRAATNLAATRAQGVSLQRLPKRKHARVEPLRITARARTRRTTRTLPSDLLRGQRRWDAFAPSSRAKPCPASFHLVDQRPVYLDME